jgi:hypothetical protein
VNVVHSVRLCGIDASAVLVDLLGARQPIVSTAFATTPH